MTRATHDGAAVTPYALNNLQSEPRARAIEVTEYEIAAHLVDGRTIIVPIVWSWRLAEATPAQRAHWELIGDGEGVHWPVIDEDLSVHGMLHGTPARRRERQ